jgi:hypothetical protein
MSPFYVLVLVLSTCNAHYHEMAPKYKRPKVKEPQAVLMRGCYETDTRYDVSLSLHEPIQDVDSDIDCQDKCANDESCCFWDYMHNK